MAMEVFSTLPRAQEGMHPFFFECGRGFTILQEIKWAYSKPHPQDWYVYVWACDGREVGGDLLCAHVFPPPDILFNVKSKWGAGFKFFFFLSPEAEINKKLKTEIRFVLLCQCEYRNYSLESFFEQRTRH